MDTDAYTEVMNAAIEAGDMNILPELWDLTLVAKARGDGAIFRERMTRKIPEIALRYGMQPVTPFPKFANLWRAEALARKYMNKGGIARAIKELIPKGTDEQIIHLSKMRPNMPWEDFALIAVEHNKSDIAEHFFRKFQRENEKYNVIWEAKKLFNIALEKGNSDLILYFLYFLIDDKEEVMKALRFAVHKNSAYTLSSIMRELPNRILEEITEKFFQQGEADVAEKLIANGVPAKERN